MISIVDTPPKIGFTFKFVNKFNVLDIVEKLKISNWLDFPKNSPAFHSFKESKFLSLISLKSTGIGGTLPIESVIDVEDQKLFELTKPILDELTKNHNGRVIRATFIKLPTHKKITSFNEDVIPFSRITYRFIIAIESNESIYFKVSKDLKRINNGECWELNNNLTNTIWNIGLDDLTYLIVDVMPEEYFEK